MSYRYHDTNTLTSLVSKIATKVKDLISGKADKATTLSGYGITNAYTKSETDTALSGKVNKSGDTMTGKTHSSED